MTQIKIFIHHNLSSLTKVKMRNYSLLSFSDFPSFIYYECHIIFNSFSVLKYAIISSTNIKKNKLKSISKL